MTKTSQLQIRVSPEEKAAIKRLAAAAGQTVSRYVLARVIPGTQDELGRIVGELQSKGGQHRAALADLDRLLDQVPAQDFTLGLSSPDLLELPPTVLNYVAAMVEQAAHQRGLDAPSWVGQVPPLERPHFMWSLQSLRPHQIRVTPLAFKRRNLFLDPAAGPRV